MTSRTRRCLFTCVVVVALTLPAESVLLRAIGPGSVNVAQTWADGLSIGQVESAAAQVQTYPYKYRREILRRLSPEGRAKVWRNHIYTYVSQHADLDESVKALLYSAGSLATADVFNHPTEAVRTQVGVIAEQVKILLGKDDADYLFYRLGPRDGTFASAAPLSHRLANFVRTRFVVEARHEHCDCTPSFGCGEATYCSPGHGCFKDEEWPMCGWWWNTVCNGLCSAGLEGS